jgi:hypothetical protein
MEKQKNVKCMVGDFTLVLSVIELIHRKVNDSVEDMNIPINLLDLIKFSMQQQKNNIPFTYT